MRKKSKRTKGIEQAHPFEGMSQVNPNAAGVDIGAEEIVVVCSGQRDHPTGSGLWQLHGGFARHRRLAGRAQGQNGGDGKHRGVLDPAV
jgi:hypothetical protein